MKTTVKQVASLSWSGTDSIVIHDCSTDPAIIDCFHARELRVNEYSNYIVDMLSVDPFEGEHSSVAMLHLYIYKE